MIPRWFKRIIHSTESSKEELPKIMMRRLGRTELSVSAIGQDFQDMIWGTHSVEQVAKLIKFLRDMGVNFFSSVANNVSLLGKAGLVPGNNVYVSLTFHEETDGQIKSAIKKNIRELNSKYITIAMMDSFMGIEEYDQKIKNGVLAELKRAKKAGVIKFIGIKTAHKDVLKKAILSDEFDIIDTMHSMAFEINADVFELAQKHNVGVIASDIFAGGILLNRDVNSENIVKGITEMNISNASKYVLANKNISCCSARMTSIDAAWAAVENAMHSVVLSEDEKNNMRNNMINVLGKDFCRSCKMCFPCKELGYDFNIDVILRTSRMFEKYKINRFKEEYAHMKLKADKCTQCGSCEAKCPFKIQIGQGLKAAHKILSE